VQERRGYPFWEIEPKWQRIWEESGAYHTDLSKTERKLYCLVMFSYPSSDRLHIGHWYNYGPTDTWARYKRMQGYNVFEPVGFDAFGLPAENYAIKTGVHPAKSTYENIHHMRRQLRRIGAMYDWKREIVTSEPSYYKWTQWIFLQLYKTGLAYRKEAPVNWCPNCRTVLANEQVIEGRCERCGTQVVRRDMEQWFFKITDYAERLLEGLDRIEWPEKTKTMQRNWIGRSEGAEIDFPVAGRDERIRVFTTRPDTLFGATYVVLAPEHPLVEVLTTPERRAEVEAYVHQARTKSEIERLSTEREKTGVYIGAEAINPATGERIPIWIADYVLLEYGTGAIMAVPAHDERDWEFAKKFGLPIRVVIRPKEGGPPDDRAYTDPGVMVNSGEFTGLDSEEGKEKVIAWLEERGIGERKVRYRLRDWLISRQRYWGAPIPIVYCERCGIVPVPEEDLPVLLPEDVDFTPRGDGRSPLATSEEFVRTRCPSCGGPAERETDTMDTFVDSSWYFLRYLSPERDDVPWDRELADRWLPVDQYVGGAEHATMHLLYARFIIKVLYDLGHISFDEPFQRLFHQGVITRGGAKMSKSKGNVVNPDEFIDQYGSDTFRCYMMFMGAYEEGGDWDDRGIQGVHRFLNRVWRLVTEYHDPSEPLLRKDALDRRMHRTIKKVGEDIERFHFNTAISAMMEWVNDLYQELVERPKANFGAYLEALVQVLAPFAPHLGEELWRRLGHTESVFDVPWPSYDPDMAREEEVEIPVQVNGKVRARLRVPADVSQEELERQALSHPNVQRYLGGRPPKRVIVVPGKLVSVVVGK